MRTPGADKELAAGFLFTEGIISQAEILRMCSPLKNL
jgi:formate dehydrogenase assembly factor FdhD